MTRSQREVEAMVQRVDDAYPNRDRDAATDGVYQALLWFVGERTDDDVAAFFEE